MLERIESRISTEGLLKFSNKTNTLVEWTHSCAKCNHYDCDCMTENASECYGCFDCQPENEEN